MKLGTQAHLRSGRLVPYRYNRLMKHWHNIARFDTSQPARFRLTVLEFFNEHGLKATTDAFNVSPSTIYLWRSKMTNSGGKLSSLIPQSTRPKHTRTMVVDPRLAMLIKSVRKQYGRVGKETLKPLLDAYAQELGITGYGMTKIGKIIKRNNYFFDQYKIVKRRKSRSGLRTRSCPKVTTPGYIQLDSITIYVAGIKRYFLTAIDIYTKLATARLVPTLAAKHTVGFISDFQMHLSYPIHTIQTDNGSEFLGVFAEYVESLELTHIYSFPHTPTANGYVERFNWTIQDNFTNRCDELWTNEIEKVKPKLDNFLSWYNTVRPHQSLGRMTPAAFTEQYFSNMYAS